MIPVATDQTPPEHPQSDASRPTVVTLAEGVTHPAYDAAGVDRSLIRWMLSLTPSDRLRHVQGIIDLVRNVRRVPNGNR
ncbi:MAG TPA: hypothetical protein VGC79_01365 [Polyangiaceae bacterium]